MPRIGLKALSFEERSEAKKLGAKFDWKEKIWFIPEGVDKAPFQKWIRPLDDFEFDKSMWPKEIIFVSDKEGLFKARIDNLEVTLSIGGCDILLWHEASCTACEHATCPEGKDLHYDAHCPHPVECPYEESYEYFESNFSYQVRDALGKPKHSISDFESRTREIFREQSDGIAHRKVWPEPAASMFVLLPWKYKLG